MVTSKNSYLSKQPDFKFKLSSVFIFIAAALAVLFLNIVSSTVFFGQAMVPYFARTGISLILLLLLAWLSIRLLKQNRLTADALGLKVSGSSFFTLFLPGVLIGVITVILLGLVLYVFVPYHFVRGPLGGLDVLKASLSFFVGNSSEEFMFRGFLLIILCQSLGWRKAVCIMALPFGLFHLTYIGFTLPGLKMVISTTAFAFIFSYALILTGSVWTAIFTHMVANLLLHTICGLDGANQAVWIPVFDSKWPAGYDLGVVVSLIAVAITASGLYFLIKFRYKSAKEKRRSIN